MPPLDKVHQLERRARTIVESLQGTWSRGKGMCCCPAHDDRTPSLSVTLGRKAILFHCFAGCSNDEVIAALDRQGIRSRDLFDGSGAFPLGGILAGIEPVFSCEISRSLCWLRTSGCRR